MHVCAWETANDVVLTPPNPEHLVAAGILASALGHPCAGELAACPAPVLVAGPIQDTADRIRAWLRLSQRPRLWLIALDAQTLRELQPELGAAQAATAAIQSAGARFVIGPAEIEPDPVGRVVQRLRSGLDIPIDARWTHLAKTASRRCQAVRRALHPPLDAPDTAASVAERRQAIAMACALSMHQGRNVSEAWNIGGLAWERIRTLLNIPDDRWHSAFIDALHWVDADPADGIWSLQVIGFSATTTRLRTAARQAARDLAAKRTLLIVPHDEAEAMRLAAVIQAVARGADGGVDYDPIEYVAWRPGSTAPGHIRMVAICDEAAAYAAVTEHDISVLDIPPLDERSMDIPHIALSELWRLHRTACRPGAPRAGVDAPEQLAWLSTRSWPTGVAGLRSWLRGHLEQEPGGAWANGDPALPLHPGLVGRLCLGHALTLDTATAQIVRWALGAHSQQRVALQRLGVGTCRLPACVTAEHGRPRRLLRTTDRWIDPWSVHQGIE